MTRSRETEPGRASHSALEVSRTPFERRRAKRALLMGRKRIHEERLLIVANRWARPSPHLHVATRGQNCSRESSKSTLYAVPAVERRCAFLPPRRQSACGGVFAAAVTEPAIARRILKCLGLPPWAPPLTPPAPPEPSTGSWFSGPEAFDFDQTPPGE